MLSSSIPKRQIQIEGINKYVANLKSNIISSESLENVEEMLLLVDETARKMIYGDEKNNTCYYSIHEFALRIGVSVSTLRLWDKQNRLKPHHKTAGGHRIYSEEQALRYITNTNRGGNE